MNRYGFWWIAQKLTCHVASRLMPCVNGSYLSDCEILSTPSDDTNILKIQTNCNSIYKCKCSYLLIRCEHSLTDPRIRNYITRNNYRSGFTRGLDRGDVIHCISRCARTIQSQQGFRSSTTILNRSLLHNYWLQASFSRERPIETFESAREFGWRTMVVPTKPQRE